MATTSVRRCPSCGAEYSVGVAACADCGVVLVATPGGRPGTADDREGLVELGSWPRLSAQILRARLETAGIDVLTEWSGSAPDGVATLAVPARQATFARAVVHEIDVEDEVPDTSPFAYVSRIEEHLSVVAELLEELRTRLDQLETRRQTG